MTWEHVDGEALVVADGGQHGRVGEILVERLRHDPDGVEVGGAGLAPDVVRGEVAGDEDQVEVGLRVADVGQRGLQRPGRGVAGVLAPPPRPRPRPRPGLAGGAAQRVVTLSRGAWTVEVV